MTWQAYPVGLGTATGYILLANLKPHPDFLTQIEIGLFILNMIVFFGTTSLLAVQLVLYPRQFKRVAFDPNKNSFIPTFVLVLATLIVGTVNYGPKVGVTPEELIVIFWIYVAIAICVAFTVLTIWFSSPRNPTASMTRLGISCVSIAVVGGRYFQRSSYCAALRSQGFFHLRDWSLDVWRWRIYVSFLLGHFFAQDYDNGIP